MRDLIILLVHAVATLMRVARPRGVRAVVAESVLAKHQLMNSQPFSAPRPEAVKETSFGFLGLNAMFA